MCNIFQASFKKLKVLDFDDILTFLNRKCHEKIAYFFENAITKKQQWKEGISDKKFKIYGFNFLDQKIFESNVEKF